MAGMTDRRRPFCDEDVSAASVKSARVMKQASAYRIVHEEEKARNSLPTVLRIRRTPPQIVIATVKATSTTAVRTIVGSCCQCTT